MFVGRYHASEALLGFGFWFVAQMFVFHLRWSQDQICCRKSFRFSEILGILLSEFLSIVFIPGAVGLIRKFPTAIFSHPTFLTNI